MNIDIKTMSEKVSFRTSDGVTIVADYHERDGDGPSALLLHMMPAVKESWAQFAGQLLDAGFSRVLAIDLRGHGESRESDSGELDYKLFEDEDHQAKTDDVEAAVAWLEERGAEKTRLAVIGASIGANLAIVYGGEHNEIPAVVALSPGLDYRGVTTPDKVKMYSPAQGLYIVASEEDELSFRTNRELAALKEDSALRELSGVGHGTTMLENEPGLSGEIIDWLKEQVR
jgi:pimeloyl-ACP methyl ester carboxylesterase